MGSLLSKCHDMESEMLEKKTVVKKIMTEVYSRVCGYYRPVNQWNKGKQNEFEERVILKNPMEVLCKKQ